MSEWTDGRAATLNAVPREGHLIIVLLVNDTFTSTTAGSHLHAANAAVHFASHSTATPPFTSALNTVIARRHAALLTTWHRWPFTSAGHYLHRPTWGRRRDRQTAVWVGSAWINRRPSVVVTWKLIFDVIRRRRRSAVRDAANCDLIERELVLTAPSVIVMLIPHSDNTTRGSVDLVGIKRSA